MESGSIILSTVRSSENTRNILWLSLVVKIPLKRSFRDIVVRQRNKDIEANTVKMGKDDDRNEY